MLEAVTLFTWSFDILLGLGLLVLAWKILNCKNLFTSIVLFIAFGLLMALIWARLDAPDVALAEAAIGAGLTGALLLTALTQLPADDSNNEIVVAKPLSTLIIKWFSVIVLLPIAAGLAYAILSLPPVAAGLSSEIQTHLSTSGVINPVTAVLLNFRAYDTLLEMAVLLIALLGVWSLGDEIVHHENAPDSVVITFSRLLTPILVLVAAYLLWVGAHAPGGAFQAGSILAAAAVILLLSGYRMSNNFITLPLRLILVTGTAAFVLMAVLTFFIEGQLLKFSPNHAATMILILEILATMSIGAILACLFLGGKPKNNIHHRREESR